VARASSSSAAAAAEAAAQGREPAHGQAAGPRHPPSRLSPHEVKSVVQEEVLLQESKLPSPIPLPGWFAALFVQESPHPGSFVGVLLGAGLLFHIPVPCSPEEGRHTRLHQLALASQQQNLLGLK
jgi:hypothetical protein